MLVQTAEKSISDGTIGRHYGYANLRLLPFVLEVRFGGGNSKARLKPVAKAAYDSTLRLERRAAGQV